MRVAGLALTDFRSYEDVRLVLPAGTVVLLGANGQGKTNLVEAIHVLSTLGSHRVSADAPLVRSGADQAVLRAVVHKQGREVTLDLELNPGRANRVRIAGGRPTRARDLLGVLRCVMFAPEDLALVRGDPAGRRRFLDDLLVQLTPRLAGVRADYDRVLKQRNALLRTARGGRGGPVDRSVLAAWDDQLVELGGILMAHRYLLIRGLKAPAGEAYEEISGTTDLLTLDYTLGDGDAWPAEPHNHSLAMPEGLVAVDEVHEPSAPSAATTEGSIGPLIESSPEQGGEAPDGSWDDLQPGAALLEACWAQLRTDLRQRADDELDRGITLVGPQRHDLLLNLQHLTAKGHASHGESWSIAIALRLASLALLRADDDPVLILDDVFAELDVGRRRRLVALVSGVEQLVVTAAVHEDVPEGLGGTIFHVTKGQVAAS